jgi:hypothetical protein
MENNVLFAQETRCVCLRESYFSNDDNSQNELDRLLSHHYYRGYFDFVDRIQYIPGGLQVGH